MNIIFIHCSYGEMNVYDTPTTEKMRKCIEKVCKNIEDEDDLIDKILKNIDEMENEKTGRSIRRFITNINSILCKLSYDRDDLELGTGFDFIRQIE